MTENQLFKKYEKAIKKEQLQVSVSTEEIYGTMLQLSEIAHSLLVPRSYNFRYHLTTPGPTFDSVASHSFFLENLMDAVLGFLYGPDFDHTSDGFSYREVMQAARRHDLPEIITTDIPDNGDRDDQGLARQEDRYWSNFAKKSPPREVNVERSVSMLLKDSRSNHITITGGQLHAADKMAAIFVNLCLEELGYLPIMNVSDPEASQEEYDQMLSCERTFNLDGIPYCYASEMWSMSFFDRGTYKLDYGNYFTALLIMKTIAVTGKWYTWRKPRND